MPEPFTIIIFVPDGDPEGVRIINQINWTGVGIAFPRSKWRDIKNRVKLRFSVFKHLLFSVNTERD